MEAAEMSISTRMRLKREVWEFVERRLSSGETKVLESLGIYCRSKMNLDVDDLGNSPLLELHRELHAGTGQNSSLRGAILRLRYAGTISKAKGVEIDTKGKEIVKKRRREEEEEEERREKKKKKKREEVELEQRKKRRLEEVEWEQRKKRRLEEMNVARRAAEMACAPRNIRLTQEDIDRLRKQQRKALERVEKEVDIVDNFKVFKDFSMLLKGSTFAY